MNEPVEEKKSQRWGVMIAALYTGFVIFILAIVLIASRQHFDLVESDYYEQGLAYQDRIENTERAGSLSTPVTVELNDIGDSIVVTFPPECALDSIDGTLYFYRPSNARWDRDETVDLRPDGSQAFPVRGFIPGMWRLKTEWRWDSQDYYFETTFFVPARSSR